MNKHVLLNNTDTSDFKLKEWGGKTFPVATRRRGISQIDRCPFCGHRHTHSRVEGHHNAHCKEKPGFKASIVIDNITLYQSDGYFVEDY